MKTINSALYFNTGFGFGVSIVKLSRAIGKHASPWQASILVSLCVFNIYYIKYISILLLLIFQNIYVIRLLSVVTAEDFQHQLRVAGSQRGTRTGRVLVLFGVGPPRNEVFTRVIMLFLAFSTNCTVHLSGAGEGGKHWENKQEMKSTCNRGCAFCRLLLPLPSRGGSLLPCIRKAI